MTSFNRRIFTDSILVTLLGVVAQVLGFVLTMLVAKKFGATWITDSYYLAFVIPGMLIGIVGGVVKIVFIPVFVEERIKNPQKVSQVIGSTVAAMLIASGISVVLVAALSYSNVLSLGLDQEARTLTQVVLIELLPLIPLTMVSGVFAAVYNSYQRFALPGIINIFRFLVIILVLVLMSDTIGIHSLVYGRIAGQFLVVLGCGWAISKKLGLSIMPRFTFGATFRRMFRMSFLPFLSYVLVQLNPLISRFIASFLSEGSITIVSYAEKLAAIPSLAIGTGFMGVVVSHWSKSEAEGNHEQLQSSLNRSVSMMLTILTPIIIGLFIVREPLIMLLLQRGAFGKESVERTAEVFSILVIAVMPTYLHMLLCRILVAKKDILALFWTSLLPICVHPVLCYIFAIILNKGPLGIALSTLVTSSMVFLTTVFIVHFKHVPLLLFVLRRSILRIMIASLLMVFILLLFQHTIQASIEQYGLFFEICSIGFLGSIVYVGFLRLIHHSDIVDIFKIIQI